MLKIRINTLQTLHCLGTSVRASSVFSLFPGLQPEWDISEVLMSYMYKTRRDATPPKITTGTAVLHSPLPTSLPHQNKT